MFRRVPGLLGILVFAFLEDGVCSFTFGVCFFGGWREFLHFWYATSAYSHYMTTTLCNPPRRNPWMMFQIGWRGRNLFQYPWSFKGVSHCAFQKHILEDGTVSHMEKSLPSNLVSL